MTPQGTLAEKIRSGGAGIPAFYTKTGAYTYVETGQLPIKFEKGTGKPEILSTPKKTRIFNNKRYVEEETIFGDIALIKAAKADKTGNLYFSKTARNFNAPMATAAHIVVAEVEELVEDGEIPPEHVHVPGVYVDRIFVQDPNSIYSKKIVEKHPIREDPVSGK